MPSRHQQQRARAIAYMGRACYDCGDRFAGKQAVFQFDHMYGKDGPSTGISYLLHAVGWERIIEELKKCELVCANCHAIRTAERREFGCSLNDV